MKIFGRILLLLFALIFGGGLGYVLLRDFEPIGIVIFSISCVVLGYGLYQIDKRLFGN